MAKQEQTEFEKKVLEQFMSGKNLLAISVWPCQWFRI